MQAENNHFEFASHIIWEERQQVPLEQRNNTCDRRDDKIAFSCMKKMGNLS